MSDFRLSNVYAEHQDSRVNRPNDAYYDETFCDVLVKVILSRISVTSKILHGDMSRHINGSTWDDQKKYLMISQKIPTTSYEANSKIFQLVIGHKAASSNISVIWKGLSCTTAGHLDLTHLSRSIRLQIKSKKRNSTTFYWSMDFWLQEPDWRGLPNYWKRHRVVRRSE